MKIKSLLFAILSASLIFSSCASMDRDDIDWENTNYQPIGSGGYLPDKWASSYSGSQTETAVGCVMCYSIVLLPIGAPLALNGVYRAHRYEAEGKKEEYKFAYQKQLAKKEVELELYKKKLEAEKETYKKQLEEEKAKN